MDRLLSHELFTIDNNKNVYQYHHMYYGNNVYLCEEKCI